MNSKEKLLWMFKQVHGEVSKSCYLEVEEDDELEPIAVNLMKDGNVAWTATKLDLVFDYMTKFLDDEETADDKLKLYKAKEAVVVMALRLNRYNPPRIQDQLDFEYSVAQLQQLQAKYSKQPLTEQGEDSV